MDKIWGNREKEIPKREGFEGGMAPEAAEEKRKQDVKTKMENWTPRQNAAFEFLMGIPNYAQKLTENQITGVKLTVQKLEFVEKFAKDPGSVIKSAKYDDKEGKFSAEGKNTAYAALNP